MSKKWLSVLLLSLCVTAGFADDKPKKDKDGSSQPFRKVEVPKPKIEIPKPKQEAPKPAAPKPNVEIPKPKQVNEIPKGKIADSKPVQPVQDVSKPKIELPNKNKLKNEIFNGANGAGIGFGPNPGNNKQPTIRNRDNDDNRNRDRDGDRDNRSREIRRNDNNQNQFNNKQFNNNQHQHHDGHSHDPHHDSKVRTSTLLQLFVAPAIGSNRPYGYGGYRNDWSDHDHHHHYHAHPQTIIVPVQPQVQQFSSGSNVPPPPRLVVPTADQFGGLAPPHQREVLLQAINSLDDDLTRVATGPQWKKHLQLDGLQESLTEVDGPLDAPDREKFRKHADVFEDVAKQPAYRAVADLWGFGTLRIGLREFSLEPIVRIRRAIAMNAGWLSQSLDGVGTGAQWKQHLRLDMLQARDQQPPTLDEELTRMETALVKFEKVKSNPQFESIAAMPGFPPTHAALSDYVQELRLAAAPPPAQVESTNAAEPSKELPPPPALKKSDE